MRAAATLGDRIFGGRFARCLTPLAIMLTGIVSSVEGQDPVASDTVLDVAVEEVGNRALTQLEHVREFLANGQSADAVVTLRRVMEVDGAALIRVSPAGASFQRWLPLSEYGHGVLAGWHNTAPQALAIYRRRVDPLAQRWCDEGTAGADARILQRVSRELLGSTHADQALWLLGELALEQGDYHAARHAWTRISAETMVTPAIATAFGPAPGTPLWQVLQRLESEDQWQALVGTLQSESNRTASGAARIATCASTTVSLADLRARLVLVSILEGSPRRARLELELFRRLHPDVSGSLAGRRGVLSDVLAEILEESGQWPERRRSSDWPTFAGSFDRNATAHAEVDPVRRVVWDIPLPLIRADAELVGHGRPRIAEQRNGLNAYHPVAVDGITYWTDRRTIRALRTATGEPAFPVPAADAEPGVVYRYEGPVPPDHPVGVVHWGVARYSVSVADGRLFARMGPQWIGRNDTPPIPLERRSFIVGLDLATGKMLFDRVYPPDDGWQFEGAPVTQGGFLYVAMRRWEEGHARSAVLCIDTQQGRPLWTTVVCRGRLPSGRAAYAVCNSLLTLHHSGLYLNTNLGVVARLDPQDGSIRWLSSYPRRGNSADPDQSDRHAFRDLNPCLVSHGYVVCAPSDCDSIFALDPSTGMTLWTTRPQSAVDVVHLLGVAERRVIASGDSVYWINLDTGQSAFQFPSLRGPMAMMGRSEPLGFGRGILAGDYLYWPTRDSIYVLDAATPRMVRQPIELSEMGLTGGNLLASGDVLLIAAPHRLAALSRNPRLATPNPPTDLHEPKREAQQ